MHSVKSSATHKKPQKQHKDYGNCYYPVKNFGNYAIRIKAVFDIHINMFITLFNFKLLDNKLSLA